MSNAPIVEIEVRSVYGNQVIYPANETAQIFAQLAGKKSLSKSDLNLIRALGFEVEQVFQKERRTVPRRLRRDDGGRLRDHAQGRREERNGRPTRRG